MSDPTDNVKEQSAADTPDSNEQTDTTTQNHCKLWWSAYAVAFTVTVIVAVGLFGGSLPDKWTFGDWSGWLIKNFILTLLVFLILAGSVTFVRIFACAIPEDDGQTEKLKWRWMTFAYGFMLFAMFAAVTPFVFDIRANDIGTLRQSPISVLVGCAEPGNGVPGELSCPEAGERITGEEASANSQKPEGQSVEKSGSAMWVLNLGGEVTSCDGKEEQLSCRIEGGLVLPIYLVILALFGGAISLTRRVPEYQKQAADDYVGTENAPRLEPHRLREYLIFQIVQFVSAPFIAVVAYYVVEPVALSTSVALGFAAGFASESILLMIRAVVDKIRPAAKQSPSTGAVSGYVTYEDGQPVKDAEVQIVGVDGLSAETTDEAGCFVINEIPAGRYALEVRHHGTKKTRLEEIHIKAGSVIVRKVNL